MTILVIAALVAFAALFFTAFARRERVPAAGVQPVGRQLVEDGAYRANLEARTAAEAAGEFDGLWSLVATLVTQAPGLKPRSRIDVAALLREQRMLLFVFLFSLIAAVLLFVSADTASIMTATASAPIVGSTLNAYDEYAGGYSLAFLKHQAEKHGLKIEVLSVEPENTEKAFHELNYTLAWGREDGGRFLVVNDGVDLLSMEEFMDRIGLEINSSQTGEETYSRFKTGKYIGRLMRPTKASYVMSADEADVHFNDAMAERYPEAVNDGLSIISPHMAQRLGVDSEIGSTGQLTIVGTFGLVKGHYVVREIDHDAVVYGEQNIKSEVQLHSGEVFFAAEPIKGTKRGDGVLLDIQTAFNLMDVFGKKQLAAWAQKGIRKAVADIIEGRLSEVFSLKEGESFDPEQERGLWSVRAAVRRGVDYREFKTLLTRAWRNYKQRLARYGSTESGKAAFRIPLPGASRAYVRTCRRHMDGDGNFRPAVDEGEIFVGKDGSFFIHPADAVEFHAVHGGSDEDDAFVFIPLADGRTVAFRNPNQYGEVGVYDVDFAFDVEREAELLKEPHRKDVSDELAEEEPPARGESEAAFDVFADVSDEAMNLTFDGGEYTMDDLVLEWNQLQNGGISIGVAANAGMVKSAVRQVNPELAEMLDEEFNWDLEAIIDAANKDGVTKAAKESMETVDAFFEYLDENNVEVPRVALDRIPEDYRDGVEIAMGHPMDLLMGQIERDLEHASNAVEEKAKQVTLQKSTLRALYRLREQAAEWGYINLAKDLRGGYGQIFASCDAEPGSEEFSETIERAQKWVADKLGELDEKGRIAVTAALAYEVYANPSEHGVRDSIVWISDQYSYKSRGDSRYRDELLAKGTSRYMLRILQLAGNADILEAEEKEVDAVERLMDAIFDEEPQSTVRRVETQEDSLEAPDVQYTRVWQRGGLPENLDIIGLDVEDEKVTLHYVEGQTVRSTVVNLGDESPLTDGAYDVVGFGRQYSSSMTLGVVEC